jgi:hypothetical protein
MTCLSIVLAYLHKNMSKMGVIENLPKYKHYITFNLLGSSRMGYNFSQKERTSMLERY